MAAQTEAMSAEDIRACERVTMLHTPQSVLMDRAAAAVVSAVSKGKRVALLVGSGNNGGDALLAGALLARQGAQVSAVLLSHNAHERALSVFSEAGGRVIHWLSDEESALQSIDDADTVIDGITGIGGTAGLRLDAARAVAAIPAQAEIIAVDIPSGLNADSPANDLPHVHADTTVTFTAPKVCLVTAPAMASAGQVIIADVGIDLLAGA